MRYLLLTLTLLFASAAQANTLYFTAIPDEDETRLQERFSKVADYLAGELDVEVVFIPVKSYAASITAFRNNQVQLAWFGGLSGVQARERVAGSRAIAQGVEDIGFYNYFIAHHSTGLEREDELSEDVRGKTFTFGSRGSTSGRLMPEFYIRDRFNEAPDRVFSRVGYSGNHTRTIALVESGAYEVGALNFAVWDKMVEDGEIDTDKVKVIWKSPAFANYQWTIRGDVDSRFGKGFTDRVQQALLDMDDPELLASFPRERFIKVDNDAYDAIREVGQSLGILD
ncbi:MAG: putative selenate ABC transporter substrate-binding protein [Halomonadaceae bacterium]|nr:MAG: putative selenate ABC transporter substrate-binding protein [Halomonadaceae bacterium]